MLLNVASLESGLNGCTVAADAELSSLVNVFEHAADAEAPSGEREAYRSTDRVEID